MRQTEVSIPGQAVSRAKAIKELSKTGGWPVTVCVLDADGNIEHEVTVYARYHANGEVQGATVNWSANGSVSPDEADEYAGLITIAAGLAREANKTAPQVEG